MHFSCRLSELFFLHLGFRSGTSGVGVETAFPLASVYVHTIVSLLQCVNYLFSLILLCRFSAKLAA
jgi:hypothetical protein